MLERVNLAQVYLHLRAVAERRAELKVQRGGEAAVVDLVGLREIILESCRSDTGYCFQLADHLEHLVRRRADVNAAQNVDDVCKRELAGIFVGLGLNTVLPFQRAEQQAQHPRGDQIALFFKHLQPDLARNAAENSVDGPMGLGRYAQQLVGSGDGFWLR